MGALAFNPERQSARMAKIKNGGLDQYGPGPFEQQQFGTAGAEGVNARYNIIIPTYLLTYLSFLIIVFAQLAELFI